MRKWWLFLRVGVVAVQANLILSNPDKMQDNRRIWKKKPNSAKTFWGHFCDFRPPQKTYLKGSDIGKLPRGHAAESRPA